MSRAGLTCLLALAVAAAPAPADATTVPPLRRHVRFVGPIQGAWRAALEAHGVLLRGYVPPDGLAVAASPEALAWLATRSFVAGIDDPGAPGGQVRAARRLAVDPTAAALFAVRVLVPSDAPAVRAAIVAQGGRLVATGAGVAPSETIIDVEGTGALAAALAADPRVEAVEATEAMRVFNDLAYGMVQSGTLHNGPVWAAGLHGEGQIVGVADVGVSGGSCYFSGDKIISQTVLYAAAHDHTHGTHTAGSIAGDAFANGTFDLHDGMAPAARLVVQDAGTADTGDLLVPSDLGALLAPTYAAGARIHSDSWGGTDRGYGVKERALDAFVAAHPDMLVVLAAGNNGAVGSAASPTTAKNILVVGALDSNDPEHVADFSSRGPTVDGRVRPTLVAPGVGVVSAKAGATCDTTVLTGTSMAAPIAAGAAALARQYFTDGFYPTGHKDPTHKLVPSAALLKAVLMAGAQPMLGEGSDIALPAPTQGYGRLQLDGALYLGGSGPRLWVRDDPVGLALGDTFTTTLALGGGPVRIALAWTDPPALEGTSLPLVDDLDLELDGPDGSVRWGNRSRATGGPEAAADHTNNEEVLNLASLPAGTYTLRVRGFNVPMGPQSFALVAVADFAGATGAGQVTDAAGHVVEREPAAAGCAALPADAGATALCLLFAGAARLRRRRGV